jgi:hypothetical protein
LSLSGCLLHGELDKLFFFWENGCEYLTAANKKSLKKREGQKQKAIKRDEKS